jgi:hypothetical protein
VVHAVWIGLVAAALVTTGCGSSDKKDTSEASAGGGESDSGKVATAGPLTKADCDRLLDHMLALLIADKKKTAKPDEVPTEEDAAKTRARMSTSRDECIGSPRAPYDCAMKAETTEGLRLCFKGGRP